VLVLQSTGSAGFIYFTEIYSLLVLLSYCAFTLPPANRISLVVPGINLPAWTLFQGALVLSAILLPLWLVFWRTDLIGFSKIKQNPVLIGFAKGTLANYAEIFCYRFANNFFGVLANIIILKALGISAPFPLLFAAVPVMVNIAYWPVSAGGFGGPQLAAYFLLKGYASEDAVMAYSLVWSSLFFITRSLTGIPFLRPIYKAAFPPQNKK